MSEARCEQQTQAVQCRPSDRQCKVKKRANETEQECVECRVTNKQGMARMCVLKSIHTLKHLHHWCFILAVIVSYTDPVYDW